MRALKEKFLPFAKKVVSPKILVSNFDVLKKSNPPQRLLTPNRGNLNIQWRCGSVLYGNRTRKRQMTKWINMAHREPVPAVNIKNKNPYLT